MQSLPFQLPQLPLVGLLCKLYKTVVPNSGLHVLPVIQIRKPAEMKIIYACITLSQPDRPNQPTIYHHKSMPHMTSK